MHLRSAKDHACKRHHDFHVNQLNHQETATTKQETEKNKVQTSIWRIASWHLGCESRRQQKIRKYADRTCTSTQNDSRGELSAQARLLFQHVVDHEERENERRPKHSGSNACDVFLQILVAKLSFELLVTIECQPNWMDLVARVPARQQLRREVRRSSAHSTRSATINQAATGSITVLAMSKRQQAE